MACYLVDIIEVKAIGGYRLALRFDDGASGEVDIAKLVPFEGIFEALNDENFFCTVAVNRDTGTICWKNGADISPSYLRKNLIAPSLS